MHSPVLYYAIVTGLCCILLFLRGFFPMKAFDGTIATKKHLPTSVAGTRVDSSELYEPSVGRLVIVVIDALRWDFIGGPEGRGNMPYTASLLEGKKACLLTGKARPPTVTMPRIKAMTTGTVPNFVDVALNLGSSQIMEDSLLHQARNSGMKLIFYGDETWLQLFPRTFSRNEGTTSFFVSDFTEVDNNVTRHLATELNADDWHIMVLHYLGLDHIGHVEGPQSPLVKPKLQQMDRIVKRIHRRFVRWDRDIGRPSLMLVCGDHGMKNSGSHGGASVEEILVPLIVIGETCSGNSPSTLFVDAMEDAVPQIDLVPTLSVLLGLPIPAGNLGKVIPQLMRNTPVSRQLYAMYYNCEQVAAQFKNNFAQADSHDGYLQYQEGTQLHARWLLTDNSSGTELAERVAKLYMSALFGMSSTLADSMVTYDIPTLVVASGMLWQLVVILLLELQPGSANLAAVFVVNLMLLVMSILFCWYSGSTSMLCSLTLISTPVILLTTVAAVLNILLIASSVFYTKHVTQLFKMQRGHVVLALGTFLQVVSLASSSFIEEEHQVWYFFWMTFILVMVYEQLCEAPYEKLTWFWLVLLFLHRVLRKWNQTGDKWASLPDVGDWLILHENRIYLSSLLAMGLTLVYWCCCHVTISRRGKYQQLTDVILYAAAVICVYCFRCAVANVDAPFEYSQSRGVKEVRVFWSVLTLLLTKGLGEVLFELKMRRRSVLHALGCLVGNLTCCWMLLCSLLHRPHNVVLIGAQVLMSECLYSRHKTSWWLVTTHVWVGMVVYFYQGNSNSLASVDIASGYVGQTGYNLIVVGVLLVTNTYSAPVLSYLLLVSKLVCENQKEEFESFQKQLISAHRCLILLRFFPVAVYLVLLVALRYHLFVWTVFSPKFLYESMYTAVMCGLVLFIQFLVTLVKTQLS